MIEGQLSLFDLPAVSATLPATEELAQSKLPLWCRNCRQHKPETLFDRIDGGWRLYCKSCNLVKGYRTSAESVEASGSPDTSIYDNVPLTCIEENKPEVYSIKCERCGKRHDPQVVPFFGAICRNCWKPGEVESMTKLHTQWSRS